MNEQYFYALIGVALGAALSGLGYLYRVGRARINLLNRVLFDLLEIWHFTRATTATEIYQFTDIYLAAVQKRLPGTQLTAQEKVQLRGYMAAVFKQLMARMREGFETSVKTSYLMLVKELAQEEPLLAFELSGNANLLSLLDEADHILTAIVGDEGDRDIQGFIDSLKEGASLHLRTEALSDLSSDIKRVAWKIGLIQWHRVSQRLQVDHVQEEMKLKTYVEQIVDTIVMPNIADVLSRAKGELN